MRWTTKLNFLPHALPAVIVASLSLAVPFLTADDPKTQGTAGSVTAKAAQYEGQPGGDQRYPVGSQSMEAARGAAIAYWGGRNPCAGQYTLSWTALDMGTNATASWRNPTDAWNNPDANFDCRIDLNPQADYDYPKLCTVLAHEIGHLLGAQHDPNAGQLMSAYYTDPLPGCMTESGAPAPAPTAPATDEQIDGMDIVATDEPRRTLRKKTTSAKKAQRCVYRKVSTKRGATKRVKRCAKAPVKRTAAKAKKTAARPY